MNILKRIQRLEPPEGKIRMVLDTDTFNEIDDQFALIYALNSPEKLTVEAVYAAPFYNDLSVGPGDGMEKSYNEILKIFNLLNLSPEGRVFRGSTDYLISKDEPQHSPAALDLVERAMQSSEDDPLYVVCISAITNVVSALLIEPTIIERIVVVWLGGHALHESNTYEFNLFQDMVASKHLFDCGVPLVQIPCAGVASHLITTLSEIRDYVKPHGKVGAYLYEIFENCHSDHYAYSRVIWDISTIAYLVNPESVRTSLVHSPILNDNYTWSFDSHRHLIRYAGSLDRNTIFRDLFEKIKSIEVNGFKK